MTRAPGVPAAIEPGPARILLVDDEEALVRVLARVLTAEGYEVDTATDGAQAVQLLTAKTFDAIVSDLDMPRMNGLQLLQVVRQGDFDVPVVLMTGAPKLETAMDAVSLGALRYLAKPVDTDELKNVIARAVRLKRIARLKQEALQLVSQGGLGVADRTALGTGLERAMETLWFGTSRSFVPATTRCLAMRRCCVVGSRLCLTLGPCWTPPSGWVAWMIWVGGLEVSSRPRSLTRPPAWQFS